MNVERNLFRCLVADLVNEVSSQPEEKDLTYDNYWSVNDANNQNAGMILREQVYSAVHNYIKDDGNLQAYFLVQAANMKNADGEQKWVTASGKMIDVLSKPTYWAIKELEIECTTGSYFSVSDLVTKISWTRMSTGY